MWKFRYSKVYIFVTLLSKLSVWLVVLVYKSSELVWYNSDGNSFSICLNWNCSKGSLIPILQALMLLVNLASTELYMYTSHCCWQKIKINPYLHSIYLLLIPIFKINSLIHFNIPISSNKIQWFERLNSISTCNLTSIWPERWFSNNSASFDGWIVIKSNDNVNKETGQNWKSQTITLIWNKAMILWAFGRLVG